MLLRAWRGRGWRSWQRLMRALSRTLDCAATCGRDLHADDLDRATAQLHRVALHRGKPVADKVCQHLGWEAVRNQHIEDAPARPCVCEHFEGSTLFRTEHYTILPIQRIKITEFYSKDEFREDRA